MSEPKHSGPAHSGKPPQEPEPSAEPVDEPAKQPGLRTGGSATSRLSRWLAPAALLIALIAVGVAVWALLRPQQATTAAPHYTDQQVAAARGRACTAAKTVISAVALQTHGDPGQDPVAIQAVAANARLAMVGGATYLMNNLDPATPPPLNPAIRSFATDLQEIAINALAGVGNADPAQADRLRDGEAVSRQIVDACK